MAKDFNIFLHRHLTECDLLIQSIPFRDGISITDRIIIDAVLNGCKLIRAAAAQSDIELVAKVDRIIKTCKEKLSVHTNMDASAEFKWIGITSPVTDPIEISVENIGTLSTLLNRVETEMVMSVDPLVTKMSKSLGSMKPSMTINGAVNATQKTGFIAPRSSIVSNAFVFEDVKTGLLDINAPTIMDVSLESLCSRVEFDAVAGIEMVTMLLGTRLHHSLGRGYFDTAIDANVVGTKAKKIDVANTIIELMVKMRDILIMFMYPENDSIIIDAEVTESQVKRCRLFLDIDHLMLSDIDDMTFGELDYVILEG